MPILPDNLLEPLGGENPCGEPASALRDYEKLREARRPNEAAIEAFMERRDGAPKVMTREMWSPKEPGRVIDSIVDMIGTRSKDLELAVWLAEALLWKHSLAGFVEGMGLVRGLLDRYWDYLHPLPDEGDQYMRTRHLEWVGMTEGMKDSSPNLALGFIPVTASGFTLNQYLDARSVPAETGEMSAAAAEQRAEALAAGKTSPEEFDSAFNATPKQFYKDLRAAAQTARQTVEELDEFCRTRFGADPPGFTKIKAALDKVANEAAILLRKKLDRDPDPVEFAAAAAGDAAAGEDGARAPVAIPPAAAMAFDEMVAAVGEVHGIEPGSGQEAMVRIAVAARYLRRQNPANAAAYQLMRGLRWGELASAGGELPPAALVAPATEIRTTLKHLAAQGAWAEVLELTEAAMATECGRAWLDLQRYAFRAASELGYGDVARTIQLGVKHLLEDYPALVSATLLDDTGAANPETVNWIVEIRGGA